MEALTRGAEALAPPALLLLRCLFQVPDLDLGVAARVFSDAQLFFPVAALLETRRSAQALEVCAVLFLTRCPFPDCGGSLSPRHAQ